MSRIRLQSANAVAETLLIALYARAEEARQPEPLVRDDLAAAMVERIDYDFTRSQLRGADQVFTVMRLREFDRRARDFLARHPGAVVVHIGCGLDTRFERVDDGQVTWYDLDLPEVVDLRRQLIPEHERRRDLACSVFDPAWLDVVGAEVGRPTMFLAEGVFVYFGASQVRELFLTFLRRFPGAELACDTATPLMVRMHNLNLMALRQKARLHWGLPHSRDPERWAAGIRLLDEWYYFDRPEPRLGAARLMRYLPLLSRGVGICHYRLGSAETKA